MMHVLGTVLADTTTTNTGASAGTTLIGLAIAVLVIAGLWRVFQKAGQPGWAAIIPIYNYIVLLRVAGKPWWWFILLLIPIVNIVIFCIVMYNVAVNFGKGMGFTIGLILLSFIFIPILGFGSAQYMGSSSQGGQTRYA